MGVCVSRIRIALACFALMPCCFNLSATMYGSPFLHAGRNWNSPAAPDERLTAFGLPLDSRCSTHLANAPHPSGTLAACCTTTDAGVLVEECGSVIRAAVSRTASIIATPITRDSDPHNRVMSTTVFPSLAAVRDQAALHESVACSGC